MLRELKEDVERREKAQAEVISNQAKRLEELEGLYKDEAIMRKKIHNQVCSFLSSHTCWRLLSPVLSLHPPLHLPLGSIDALASLGRWLTWPAGCCIADGGHEGQDPRVLPLPAHAAI